MNSLEILPEVATHLDYDSRHNHTAGTSVPTGLIALDGNFAHRIRANIAATTGISPHAQALLREIMAIASQNSFERDGTRFGSVTLSKENGSLWQRVCDVVGLNDPADLMYAGVRQMVVAG